MSDNFGKNPRKMLNLNKSLGEQSSYVKRALKPVFNHLSLLSKKSSVEDLFKYLSPTSDDIDFRVATLYLKDHGIEGEYGEFHYEKMENVYDDEYIDNLDADYDEDFDIEEFEENNENTVSDERQYSKNSQSENFNWKKAEDLATYNDSILPGYYLKTSFGIPGLENDSSFFIINSKQKNVDLLFFKNHFDVLELKPKFNMELNVDINIVKKIVENTVEHLTNTNRFKFEDVKDHIKQQLSDHQLETAQKTGYVQGVCESVLAFNNDENRKIMTEATMTFLSKKLLSEMNVTKDMAQKFANPDTYKALEKCVFAQNQEQQLEQTQSQGVKR